MIEIMTSCSVETCDRPSRAKGMCATHYTRVRLGIPLDAPIKTGRSTCTVDGCDKFVAGHGLCSRHYRRHRDGSPMEGDRRFKPERGCKVPDCDRPHAAKGFCMSHWRRDRDGLDVTAPIVTKLITDDLLVRLRTYAPEGAPDECWEWTRATNKGYGAMAVHGSRMRQAHVVAWELHHGKPLPEGKILRHTCDNPPCTNPAHLILGTHKENSHDRLERGREAYNGKGFRHRTPEEVTEMRRLHSEGVSAGEIARQFGCSHVTAIRICKAEVLADGTRGRHVRAKLSDDQVREIRQRCADGESQQAVADSFGIDQTTVSLIVRFRTYKDVR
jgi:hypothetical protein